MVGLLLCMCSPLLLSAEQSRQEACDTLEAGLIMLAPKTRGDLSLFISNMVLDDVLGAAVGKKSFVVSNSKRFKEAGDGHNEAVLKFVSSTGNWVDQENISHKLDLVRGYLKDNIPKYSKNPSYANILKCAMTTIAQGNKSKYSDELDGFIEDLSKKFSASTIGHFSIELKSCSVRSRVGTGNQFAEPKVWAGSRFMIIDASFKNLDSEGRLPQEGNLIIKSGGMEYKYDHTESILLDGYGIFLTSINPLVVMRTKIVYRIPDDISGEAYWEPGRNIGYRRLWCSFVSPEN